MTHDNIRKLAQECGFDVASIKRVSGDVLYWLEDTDDLKPLEAFYIAAFSAGLEAGMERSGNTTDRDYLVNAISVLLEIKK